LNNLLNYNWATWQAFFQEHWLVLVIAVIVLFIIIKVVKTILKWAIVAAILLGILVYSGYSLQNLSLDNLKSIGTQIADTAKKEAVTAMVGEAKEATYTKNDDGTFTAKTDNLEITGKIGDNEVSVSYRGAPLGKWKIDDTIQTFIGEAQRNG
jgi:hypothetical protein